LSEYGILQGDVLDRLRELDSESVHCVVTSPPYWGLRDYGTGSWDGGESDCDHVAAEYRLGKNLRNSSVSTRGGAIKIAEVAARQFGQECGKCGATRNDQQLGLEPTPAEYVAKMAGIFQEVRRVLRKDGTAWVNMGDSYANDGKWGGETGGKQFYLGEENRKRVGREKRNTGLKPKDLIGIPWRLAFALQADGWWLRQDIIWAKPNPMPESVTDRCTKAHEYIFLLSKSERYYYDADAIREDCIAGYRITPNAEAMVGRNAASTAMWRNVGDSRNAVQRGQDQTDSSRDLEWKRNKRSVWTVATQAYPEAHFATFPEELIVPCILAGCPIGGTVLDPFSGSGTTGVVALRYHRNYIGIELNPQYVALSEQRIRGDAPLFNTGSVFDFGEVR
jgi:DNA modification methylase